jgi:hypothetical protein
MVQAQPHLANATRLLSEKADEADVQITTLLKLYRKQPGGVSSTPIPIPASYARMIEQLDAHHVSETSPSPPHPSNPTVPAPSVAYGFDFHSAVPGPTSSSFARTDGASEDTEADPDLHNETDLQLLEYAKERAMSWEDLKNRPPLFPGEEGGTWQFYCAEQIIRREWL